jgi:hypothetical protein
MTVSLMLGASPGPQFCLVAGARQSAASIAILLPPAQICNSFAARDRASPSEAAADSAAEILTRPPQGCTQTLPAAVPDADSWAQILAAGPALTME